MSSKTYCAFGYYKNSLELQKIVPTIVANCVTYCADFRGTPLSFSKHEKSSINLNIEQKYRISIDPIKNLDILILVVILHFSQIHFYAGSHLRVSTDFTFSFFSLSRGNGTSLEVSPRFPFHISEYHDGVWFYRHFYIYICI